MKNYLLVCKSDSGDTYTFFCNKKPNQEEFDAFVMNNIPEEYEDGENYLNIEMCLEIENILEVKF